MNDIKAPSRFDLLMELRTPEVFPRLALGLPRMAAESRGDGEPVMAIPGFRASDASTRVLRSYLRYLGYHVRGWSMGVNRGDVPRLLPELSQRVLRYADKTGSKVRLVGWSLGGYLAREVARDHPEAVDRVITMGSPIIGGPRYTAAASFYEERGIDMDEIEAAINRRYEVPLQVPVTAIYSKGDGIVAWRACIDHRSPNVEHIEVKGSHLSLGFSPTVLRIVARRLHGEALSALKNQAPRVRTTPSPSSAM